MGDWLGTGTIATRLRQFRSFRDARRFVHRLRLKSASEWRKYCNGELPEKGTLPEDISSHPYRTYKEQGWTSWDDWLGTGAVAPQDREYRPFKEAKEFACSLKLERNREWRKFCKGELPEKGVLPEDIPSTPDLAYKDKGWVSWPDWLGTFTSARGKFRPFKEARKFVRGLGLENTFEWYKYCAGELPEKGRLPRDIPSNPHPAYKDHGWISMGDWLGTFFVPPRLREWRQFGEAREFVHGLALKSYADWQRYCKAGKLPQDIPLAPDHKYRNEGWVSWGDWLGTGVLATHLRPYRKFKQARSFVRSLGLKSGSEWRKYCKGELSEKGIKPEDIPSDPHHVYRGKGWKGMGDWLGTGTVATRDRQYRDFKQARSFVRQLKLRSQSEWHRYCKGEVPGKEKKPRDIPANPQRTYKDDWVSWPDWLGTSTRRKS